jgi:arabinose-5-phosphate isomerase
VMETVMSMTKAQGGSAAIADETGKLLGIFTDGDFRRIMATCASERTGLTQRNGETESQGSLVAEGHGAPLLRSSALENGCNAFSILNDPISDHMTRSPKFVYDTAYAVELLKIFEKMKIDDLPVCDADGRIVGLVDIQDLPKMKVM